MASRRVKLDLTELEARMLYSLAHTGVNAYEGDEEGWRAVFPGPEGPAGLRALDKLRFAIFAPQDSEGSPDT